MKPLTIAMVAACPFPANHGSPASIREMSQALAALGHKVHVVTYSQSQDLPVGGITIHRVGRLFKHRRITVGPAYYKVLLDFLLAVRLSKLVRRENVDIIHAHNYEGALAGYLAKKMTGAPMLYNAVNNMIDELPTYDFLKSKYLATWLARGLDKLIPRTADRITVVSDELYRFIQEQGIDRSIVDIVPAGVVPTMFENRDPHVMRQRHNLEGFPMVIYTGTLHMFQRIDYLLKAMRIVLDEIQDARLLLVANIINLEDLATHQRLASELGIENNILFANERPLDELPLYLASADVAVVPRPACPGFPVKLLNYMAASKAIVTFEGSAKGLKNMFNALVVKNDDWRSLGKAIVRLLSDRELAVAVGQNARQTVLKNFDWHILALKIEKIYQKLLSEQL